MPILRQPSNCRHVHVINQIIGDFHWPTILPSLKCIEAQIEARIEARIEGLLDSRKRLLLQPTHTKQFFILDLTVRTLKGHSSESVETCDCIM